MDSEEPRELTLSGAGGLRLAGEEWGQQGGRPVLLLHGGGQSRYAWKGTAARLAAAGYRVVAFDARGHGDSDWASDGAYSMDDLAADVRAVLGRFDVPPAVVGASMGGMSSLLAQGEVDDHQLFAALVLVDITPRMELGGVTRIVEFMAAHPDGFATLEDAADAISAYNPHRSRPRTSEGLERVLREGSDGRWRWRWDPAFLSWGRTRDVDPAEFEARMAEMAQRLYAAAGCLEAPTLLVRGAQSDLVSDESVTEFLAAVPHASYVDISGAGHMVAGDDNDAFSTAVVDFLREHVGVDRAEDDRRLGRERAARALRRLGHALVAHEGEADELADLVDLAERAAARLESTPARDRLAELLARAPREAEAGVTESELVLARHTMVAGTENPFSLDARYRRVGDEVRAEATLGPGFEGAPGRAHAGAVSALITETMAAALEAVGVTALTVGLNLRYLGPIPLHVPLHLQARVQGGGTERLTVGCTGSAAGRPFVEATGTFARVDLTRLATELEGRAAREPDPAATGD